MQLSLPMTGKRPKAVAYLRVSTDEQANSGLGLEAQRESILREADRLNVSIDSWYSGEGVSGGADISKRVGLVQALAALREGDLLLVAKRDRLSRDALLSCWIEKEAARRGARIISAAGEGTENDDASSLLMRRIIDAFSEYERHIISARVKAALQAKRARGEKVGNATPYGFSIKKDGKTLIKNPKEQQAIRLILGLREKGWALREIGDELARRGIKSKTGKKWCTQMVSTICREGAVRLEGSDYGLHLQKDLNQASSEERKSCLE